MLVLAHSFRDVLPWKYLIDEGICFCDGNRLLATYSVSPHDLSFGTDQDSDDFMNGLYQMHSFLGPKWTVCVDIFRDSFDNSSVYFSPHAPHGAVDFEKLRVAAAPKTSYDNKFFITYIYDIPSFNSFKQVLFVFGL